MLNPRNLIKHEFIGLDVKVLESTNKSCIGVEGKVVYETKNMIIIKSGEKEKKIQKEKNVFLFELPDGKKIKVNGEIIKKRPEERIKIKLKKW